MKTLLKISAIACTSLLAISSPLLAADKEAESVKDVAKDAKAAESVKDAKEAKQAREGITMDADKVVVVKNEKKVELTESMTLKNGTIVAKDGTVTTREGTKMTMKNGDWVNMEGEFTPAQKTDGNKP